MALKNTALNVTYTAWDTSSSVGKTGDAANHTIKVETDTATDTWSGTPTELAYGEYQILLTADQMNGDFITVSGTSSTSNVVIIPVRISTYEKTGYTASTVSDKTGYSLSSDGLDSVSTTQPDGVASNFREMIVQTWRRFFKKATQTSTQLITYKDDGTTAATTQTVSDASGTETQGEAT
jgi:hypothetical protein